MYDLILTMIQLQKIIFSADTERVFQVIIECLSKDKLKYFSNIFQMIVRQIKCSALTRLRIAIQLDDRNTNL